MGVSKGSAPAVPDRQLPVQELRLHRGWRVQCSLCGFRQNSMKILPSPRVFCVTLGRSLYLSESLQFSLYAKCRQSTVRP